jgi:hypothetical protein
MREKNKSEKIFVLQLSQGVIKENTSRHQALELAKLK